MGFNPDQRLAVEYATIRPHSSPSWFEEACGYKLQGISHHTECYKIREYGWAGDLAYKVNDVPIQ